MSAAGRRLTRRSLLAGGVGAVAAGLAAGGYEWRKLRRPSAADIVEFIQRRLGDRNLDLEGVDRFAREYVGRYGAAGMSTHHKRTLGGLLGIDAVRRRLPALREQEILEFERKMISLYLRSTDYFHTPPGTRVRYVAFAEPYSAFCANPFARFDLS
jgi:hypothetical protein